MILVPLGWRSTRLDKRWNFLVRRLDFCVKRPCNEVMKAKRIAICVRVSTTEQDTEGQEAELREYVESRGWTYGVYRDKGQSGAKSDRHELTRLLADLRKRKLDIVVVWALDRLARGFCRDSMRT
jgi:predicted site-specific integrase-resolvase